MKKSTWFLLSGICVILLAFVMDAILACVLDLSAATGFDVQKFAYLAGDAVVVTAGVLLIIYRKKLAKEEEEKE